MTNLLLNTVSITGLAGLLAVTLSPVYLTRRSTVAWSLVGAPALGGVLLSCVM